MANFNRAFIGLGANLNDPIQQVLDARAYALFDQMQNIETELGRVRVDGNQNAPRLIDIDLLMFGDQSLSDPKLTIPHPRISERLFVLKPFEELGIYLEADDRTDFSEQQLHKLAL